MMKTNVQKLEDRLADMQVAGFNVFPGFGNPTREEVAGEVLARLKRLLEEDEYELVADIGYDNFPPEEVMDAIRARVKEEVGQVKLTTVDDIFTRFDLKE